MSQKIEKAIYDILSETDNPDREGLLDTPKRFAKAWKTLTAGYQTDISSFMTTFDSEGYDQMVLLKDIEFYSLCEHHLLPFFGKIHIAYIPNGKIVGISKLARIAEVYSRRLQNQERITEQIVDTIEDALHPKGVAVVVEAAHFCMRARGVEKQNATMVTNKLTGIFKEDAKARQEFFNSI